MTRALDAATDGVVVALAVWTVLYHAALALRIPTDALLAIWVAVLAGVAVAAMRLRRPVSAGWAGGRLLPVPLALAGAAVAGVLVVQRSPGQWWAGWGVAAAVVVATLVAAVLVRLAARRRHATEPATDSDTTDDATEPATADTTDSATGPARDRRPVPRPWLALLAMAALGTLSLYTFHVDGDDAFYVNKSSWVAAHGQVSTRDTLYTDERLGHLAGAGVPVQSIESLQGAIAHLFGLSAPTVVYLVFPPIMLAAAVWALWRLIRYLAPRRASLAFLVAGAYFSVGHLGSFTFTRMWMGKAVFFSLVIPLLYLYLSRWADRRRARDALLLVAVGAASVGLMSAATVVIALAVAAGLIAMFAGSGLRTAAGALLPAAYPVGAGLLVATLSPPGVPGRAFDTGQVAMAATLGEAAVGGIAWAALIAAASLARTPGGRLAALGGAAATVAVALPAVPHAIDAATGSGIVLYRLFWVAPVPAMVGLLATLPLPRLPRWAGWVQAVPAAALVAVLLAPGAFYWGQGLLRTPAWKLDPVALTQARAIARLHPGPGPVLAPRPTMMTIGIITVDFHAVSPNASYIYNHVIPESTADADARVVLHHLMWNVPPRADVAKAPAALRRLDVSLVCLAPQQIRALKAVRRAGFVVDRGEAAGLSCLGRSPGGWPPVALGGGG